MTQRDLFERFREPLNDAGPADITPLIAANVPEADKQRLSRQCQVILDMLQVAPRLNVELAAVSLKYTSRVSDLRAAGYDVVCERIEDGVTMYRLGGRHDPHGTAVG